MGGVTGEVHGGLSAGVASADDHHVGALQGAGLGGRCAVEHPAADERFERRDAEAAIGDTTGEDHRVGRDNAAVVHGQ